MCASDRHSEGVNTNGKVHGEAAVGDSFGLVGPGLLKKLPADPSVLRSI